MVAATDQMNVSQRLGRKTFWIFLLEKSVAALVLLAIVFLFIILASIGPAGIFPSIGDQTAQAIQAFFILGLLAALVLFVILFVIALLVSWLEYRNYTFNLGDHSLEVARGILTKENISIPYHHIEDINIEQGLLYQIMGVCRVAILTAGHGDSEDKAEGILPTIDLATGREIQKFIMARSNTQEVVNMEPKATN
jgi:uncharacterized membrane protein YdbT with pleckstrin-like domain